MASFEFVGYLRPTKDSNSIKGFEKTEYDSGWMKERLRFGVSAGDNYHFVEVNAGRWKQEDKNTIYLTDNNKKSFNISWAERNDPEIIDKTAGWRVYTVNTETYKRIQKLKEDGDIEAAEKAEAKKRHFLDRSEFCEYVNKLVNHEKFKDVKFRIKGNINYNYSEKNDRYYETYEVNKIYRVDDDVEECSKVNMEFFFDENAYDDSMFDEYGKAMVSGYTPFYDSQTKKSWYCPISLVMRDKKQAEGWNRQVFSKFEDDQIRKVNLECDKISGAQRIDITYDDLSDEVKENIDFGLTTLEDAIAELGGNMFGERITELRISKLGRGSSKGSETTVFTLDDLKKKPMIGKQVVEEVIEDMSDDIDDEVPFSIDDDDDEL